jgi:hypothetical protein
MDLRSYYTLKIVILLFLLYVTSISNDIFFKKYNTFSLKNLKLLSSKVTKKWQDSQNCFSKILKIFVTFNVKMSSFMELDQFCKVYMI